MRYFFNDEKIGVNKLICSEGKKLNFGAKNINCYGTIQCIDLARAKSESFVNILIIYFFKKSCYAKRRRQRERKKNQ